MPRLFVPSTPGSRGETPAAPRGEVDRTSGMSYDQLVEAATAAGFRLIPLQVEEPAGNAARDDWANYAKSKGAVDEDLVDKDGKELGRDALREKYATPAPVAAPAAPAGHGTTKTASPAA